MSDKYQRQMKLHFHESALDAPHTTLARAELIRRNPFLHAFYRDSYVFFQAASASAPSGKRLELGSGAGFIKDVIPDVLTSEYLEIPTVDYPSCSALDLPFGEKELSALFLLDVLHHIPDLDLFFEEATRVLKPGGVIAMVEPANTLLSNFIYRNFHHEAFDIDAPDWKLPSGGPLSTANGALPWIVFMRDRDRFEERYPSLSIMLMEPFGPLLYAVSGGVGRHRKFLPDWLFQMVRFLESAFSFTNFMTGFFYRIVLRQQ